MKNKSLSIIVFLGFLTGTVWAQKLNSSRLDSLFDILAEKNKAMGSLAISKNGKVIYSRAIGYSLISEKEKKAATVETKYRIGSVSKMFTAVMLFQLIEAGKLSLTTPLNTFYPEIPKANKITIGNLMNHHSGLHDFTNDSTFREWMTQFKTKKEMLAIIAGGGNDFEPGSKGKYCNSNYVLLGYILEDIYKQPYKKILAEKILSKLALKDTYAGEGINPAKNESYSYLNFGEWKQLPVSDMSIPGGAGCIVSTPSDLTRFIENLFALKLISGNSLGQMKTMTDGYGMGMFESSFDKRTSFGHTGRIDGFITVLDYYPADSLSIAYCTNGQLYPANKILNGVLSICFNREYIIPDFKTTNLVLKSEDLDQYLGVYSSKKIPIAITVTKENSTLFAQGSGQSAFPLEVTGKDTFKFDAAGIEMIFQPDKGEMLMNQGGGSILFTKNK